MGSRLSIAGLAALSAVVCGASVLTAAVLLGWLPLSSLAATPRSVAEGRVWLLFTSGVVADQPEVVSLVAFALVGLATLAVCGSRLLWVTAVVGHVASTIVVYLAVALVRLVTPAAFERVLDLPDFGVSAAVAAWLGAMAAVGWRRYPGAAQRVWIVASCLAAGGLGWWLDPNLSALDAEHLVAFGIGVALALAPGRIPLPGKLRARRELSASRRTRTETL